MALSSDDEYTEYDDQPLHCTNCGHEWDGTVSVHERTGVAGTTCPECDKTQEPMRLKDD